MRIPFAASIRQNSTVSQSLLLHRKQLLTVRLYRSFLFFHVILF